MGETEDATISGVGVAEGTYAADNFAPWSVAEVDLDVDNTVVLDAIVEKADGIGGAYIMTRTAATATGPVWVNAEHLKRGTAHVREQLTQRQAAGPSPLPALNGTSPRLTVALPTIGNAPMLPYLVARLLAQTVAIDEILIVDNRPQDPQLRSFVRDLNEPRVRYVAEPRRGLSHARNRAVVNTSTEILAFLDDDEIPASDWADHLLRAFTFTDAACVTGFVGPFELRTYAQLLFEAWGGLTKGLPFDHIAFDGATLPRTRALFPRPAFGAGANMAYRRDALLDIGPFPVELGAGTPTKAAEDSDALTRILLAGHTIRYQPQAVTWHRHRETMEQLHSQFNSYGIGLTAWYVHRLLQEPRDIVTFARLIPQAAQVVLRKDAGEAREAVELPPGLVAEHRRGMLKGPAVYILSKLGLL